MDDARMMQISMILDTDAYIYDAANFVTDGRTNGRTDKAILGVGCVMHVKNGDERTNGKLNSRSRIVPVAVPYSFESFEWCNAHSVQASAL